MCFYNIYSRGNTCRFWQIFVEALEEFPNHLIQSKTSASTHEYSESNRASKYVMLLSNFGDENRGLSLVSEAGFRHQLVHVAPTGYSKLCYRRNKLYYKKPPFWSDFTGETYIHLYLKSLFIMNLLAEWFVFSGYKSLFLVFQSRVQLCSIFCNRERLSYVVPGAGR